MFHPPSATSWWRAWHRCSRGTLRGTAVAGITLFTACSGGTTDPSPPQFITRVSSDWVTPDLAGLIGPDGLFLPISDTPDLPDELDKEGILALLAAFNRSIPFFVGNVRSNIESEHGAPVDFANLRECGRVLYMQSSVEPIETDRNTASALLLLHLARNGFNAAWHVPYCDQEGFLVLTHTMSSRTRLFIGEDGFLALDSLGGASDGGLTIGIKRGSQLRARTPERAVEMVFEMSGTRVSSPPQLVKSSIPVAGLLTGFFWRMRTDQAVPGRMGQAGPVVEASEFYVTSNGGVQDGALLDTTRVFIAGPAVAASWWLKLEVRVPPDLEVPVLDSVLIVPRWAMGLYEFIPDR